MGRPAEIRRLRAKAPRPPLCKYFASEAEALLQDLHRCFSDSRFGPGVTLPMAENIPRQKNLGEQLALLLPHGGYCNSGFVAAHGFQLLMAMDRRPTVIIIGNNHQSWHKVALCDQTWSTPIGPVEPDMRLVEDLSAYGYKIDRNVHAEEHSIENQIPFLRYIWPGTRILAVGVGALDVDEANSLGQRIAELALKYGAVLLGTTDFSHEGPSYGGPAMSMEDVTDLTRRKDAPLLDAVQGMDASNLLRLSKSSSMCGPGSAAVFLLACRALGLTRSERLQYLVNTEVTPCTSTTGFATFSFKPEKQVAAS